MVLQVVLKLLIVLRRLFTSYKALATKNAKKKPHQMENHQTSV